MPKQAIESLVDGGKASAGPPLGPALGPMGVNIGNVISAINEKTKDMAGMKVPVKVIVDTETKGFEIEVGTPPTSALIKRELDIKKGSGEAGKQRLADLSREQAKRIAKIKFGSDDKSSVNQVRGTARSMGITLGEGEVTEEEKAAYEEAKKAEEEEAKAAEEAKKEAAAEEGEAAGGEEREGGEKEEPGEGKQERKEE